MDPLSAVGTIITITLVAAASAMPSYSLELDSVSTTLEVLQPSDDVYGPTVDRIVSVLFQDVNRIIGRVRRHVISKEPKEAGLIKQSYTESFSMVAIAV